MKTNRRHSKPARDDAVDDIRKTVCNLGLSNAEIYHNTYLSRGTIQKLLEARVGKPRTRYPSHMTLKGVAAAAGFEYRLVRRDED
jgi:hypothetical protein